MHFSFNEVKGVSSVQRYHAKETILGLGALQAPVEGDLPLCPSIAHHIGSFPAKDGFVEVCQLTAELAKVVCDSEAVSHRAKSVLEIFEETVELRRVVGVCDHP